VKSADILPKSSVILTDIKIERPNVVKKTEVMSVKTEVMSVKTEVMSVNPEVMSVNPEVMSYQT